MPGNGGATVQRVVKRCLLSPLLLSEYTSPSHENDTLTIVSIDGVLLHVAKPIPGASESLQYLQKNDIPFILLTNGGGKHEKDRVAQLSQKLNVELSTENFVQSHTPFQELVHGVEGLGDKNILVIGSDAAKSRTIAEAYGFNNVITPADILSAHPTIWPFEPLMEELYAATARPLPSAQPKIDAIFVFNDPRDWALDIQIITDLLLSENGVLGTYSSKNGKLGWQSDGQPPLFFSNPDLFWSAAYHHPRFGQGAFQAAVAGIWREITNGVDLKRTVIGKPYRQTYRYAERVLNSHRAKVLGLSSMEPLGRVYMVGDNPESDIRGANEFNSPDGTKWTSVLVRTGVWSAERGEPTYRPKMVVDDVAAAVEWALKQEGWRQ
ncbi:putative HAD superfamily hydrolase [Truncatella angustata]|uniref:HAD superfamily hydrolase n=1 Tax=Truncatella angustata TaxID=152316 RepID=A0A9P8UGE7_9PEZI|nr:putative HAD superfamily hydrolase [Truncatella angustata]KAH6651832.1 putative HAD superfamily hydrolase [Truncatella angustata]